MDDSEFYSYGKITLERGKFNLPPLLIGTIFYQNETIVDRKNPEIFNPQKAIKRIKTQQSLSEKYKIPNLVEISANTPKSMLKYLEFYLDNFDPPFVLGGDFQSRMVGIEYLAERESDGRLLRLRQPYPNGDIDAEAYKAKAEEIVVSSLPLPKDDCKACERK